MTLDQSKIKSIIQSVKKKDRKVLLENEGLEILAAAGINTPTYAFIKNSSEASNAASKNSSDRVVVKVVCETILHKSDRGGVMLVANNKDEIAKAVLTMEKSFKDEPVEGYLVAECVDYDKTFGSELLFGMRIAGDFGPIVSIGTGGIYAEHFSEQFKAGKNTTILSPLLSTSDDVATSTESIALAPIIFGKLRGQKARIEEKKMHSAINTFMELSKIAVEEGVTELEINPMVISTSGECVALDILAKIDGEETKDIQSRPVHKLTGLFNPKSIAIAGVSSKMNPGHIILSNTIVEGFDKKHLHIIKPKGEDIEGCKCYPSISQLPECVDLLVLSIPAGMVPDAISEVCSSQKAESIIVIPGGFEEKQGTSDRVEKMHSTLSESRKTEWGGPIINGGNCLGIVSKPGKYDTMFIPPYKLPSKDGEVSPLAFISQSGAFAVSCASFLNTINPRYSLSIGNQMDLTVGDFLTHLKDDKEVHTYSIYMEGFKPEDGLRFLKAAREIVESGRNVILYRAGRTAIGAQASASHTASIAGDYAVTRSLCEDAGIILADSLREFEDLTMMFSLMSDKKPQGSRLGAISNAGYECVGIADNLDRFELAEFDESSWKRLGEIFKECRIDSLVDLHNPIDLTPMCYDKAYHDVIKAVLDDNKTDAAIVGCVPLTPALLTLPQSTEHRETIDSEKSIIQQMIALNKSTTKPWVVVVDGGPMYAPMVDELRRGGVMTFRSADTAMKMLNIFCK